MREERNYFYICLVFYNLFRKVLFAKIICKVVFCYETLVSFSVFHAKLCNYPESNWVSYSSILVAISISYNVGDGVEI